MTRICVVYRDYNINSNHNIINFVLSVNISSIIESLVILALILSYQQYTRGFFYIHKDTLYTHIYLF